MPSSSFPKAVLEDAVVEKVFQTVVVDFGVDNIIKLVSDFMKNEDPGIVSAQRSLEDTDRKLKNVVAAVESGASYESLTKRVEDLENLKKTQINELDHLKRKNAVIGEDLLLFYFKRLKKINLQTHTARKYLIDTFLNSIYIYDDGRMDIFLNYRNDSDPVKDTSESLVQYTENRNSNIQNIQVLNKVLKITVDVKPEIDKYTKKHSKAKVIKLVSFVDKKMR